MIKHQVKLSFHISEWFLKPIFLLNYVPKDGSAKVTQISWLFMTYKNIVYNDGTMDFTKNKK